MPVFVALAGIFLNCNCIIEKERRSQAIQQKELAEKASIPFPTYKEFIYNKKISLENLFKLLFALRLFENISGLLHEKEYQSIQDIKNKDTIPKRIRK